MLIRQAFPMRKSALLDDFSKHKSQIICHDLALHYYPLRLANKLTRKTTIAAPITAGMMAKPARLGPHVPSRPCPIQAPISPAIIDPIIPPGILPFTNRLPSQPIIIATIKETIILIINTSYFFIYLYPSSRVSILNI